MKMIRIISLIIDSIEVVIATISQINLNANAVFLSSAPSRLARWNVSKQANILCDVSAGREYIQRGMTNRQSHVSSH